MFYNFRFRKGITTSDASTQTTKPTELTAQPETADSTSTPPSTSEAIMSDQEQQHNLVPEQEAPKAEPLKGDEPDVVVAKKLSSIIDSANERIKPMLEMLKQVFPTHITILCHIPNAIRLSTKPKTTRKMTALTKRRS
jgi:hypothetical protein